MAIIDGKFRWQEGERLQFWGGRVNGWVSAEIISVSVQGAPTIVDPLTGKRRTFHGAHSVWVRPMPEAR